MMKINELFADFETCSDEEWRSKIISDLKITDPNELAKKDENDITHLPYYRRSNLEDDALAETIQSLQQKNHSWKYAQIFSSKTRNLEALINHALEDGVDEVVISDVESIEELAKNFKVHPKEIEHLHLHLTHLAKNRTPKVIFSDPIGEMLKSGQTNDAEMDALKSLFQKRLNQLNPDNFLLIDGSIYKNAGASIVQELALSMQHAVEYLDQLTEAGYTAEAIARSFTYKLAYGTSFFSEIAKTRAFRYLIQKIYSAYNTDASVRIWGEASSYYYAHTDAYSNLLRATTQTISAIIGNCDLISVPAYDCLELSSSLGRRMAKNISLILKNESYLNKVNDISSGSYYIETLSIQYAEKAWQLFLSYEEEKESFYQMINKGSIKERIQKTHLDRVSLYRNSGKVMLGVNKYQNNSGEELDVTIKERKGISSKVLSKEIVA